MSESLSMKCRLRGLTMFVFSFGVESLELNVKLGRLVTFDFLLRTPLFPNLQPKSSAFYSVFVVRAVSQLLYCCCGGERKPTIVLLANFQRIQKLRNLRLALDWLSMSFFVY